MTNLEQVEAYIKKQYQTDKRLVGLMEDFKTYFQGVELKYQLLEAKLAEQKDRIDNIYLLMREDNKGSQNWGS